MKCRKNVKDLTSAEKTAFVQAVIDLKNTRPSIILEAQASGATSRYDDYVWIHREVGGGAHRGPAFTPWHREFLRQFELDLQEASGNPELTIPYWDWATARTPGDPGWPFTEDFMGGFGTGLDSSVQTGRFKSAVVENSPGDFDTKPGSTEWPINVRTGSNGSTGPRDDTTYLRRRPASPEPFPLPSQGNVRSCLERPSYDTEPWLEGFDGPSTPGLLASFRKFLEYVLHNGPHGWVGGNMNPMTSPNDPVFFLHHANVDRMWATWQQKHAPAITTYLPSQGTTDDHDLDDTMRLLNQTNFSHPIRPHPIDLLDHQSLGYWYASDLPKINVEMDIVIFDNIEPGKTASQSILFSIESCRTVHFRVNNLQGSENFSIADSQKSIVWDPGNSPNVGALAIDVQYRAPNDLSVSHIGSVIIEAFIEDTEGYYTTSVTGEYILGNWTLSLLSIAVPGSLPLPAAQPIGPQDNDQDPVLEIDTPPIFVIDNGQLRRIDPVDFLDHEN